MPDIFINTNTTTGEHFNRRGSSFRSNSPQVSYRSNFKLHWQLFTDTPDADMEGADISTWTKAAYPGCGAIATCDNDFKHRISCTLLAPLSTGVAVDQIAVKITASPYEVPDTGIIALQASSGKVTELEYTGISAGNGTVTVTLDAPFTPDSEYPASSFVNISQEPLFQSMYIPAESDPETGLFVFDCHAYSKRLAAVADSSASRSIEVQGLELLPFYTENDAVFEMPSYLVDTFSLIKNLAEAGAIIPEYTGDTSELLAALAALVVQGLDIQVYSEAQGWHDLAGDILSDAEYARTLTAYRLRFAGSSGDYSAPLPLVHGADAPAVKIRYSADGVAWSETPDDCTFISFSTDNGETWSDAFYVKGDQGVAAGFGTPTASAVSVPYGYPAKATVDASGPDTAKVFNIQLEIPQGKQGKRGEAFKFDATGTLEERTQYDAETKDFAYLATDDGCVYIKQSDTSGDWSEPIPFKGDKGDKAFNMRGEWVADTEYAADDAVTHNGSFYIAVMLTTSEPGTDSSWQMYVSKGEPGVKIEGNYIDVTTVTDGFIIVADETIPVAVEIDNSVFNIRDMVKESNTFKIPVAPILTAANLASYSGTWRVWRAGGKEGKQGVPGNVSFDELTSTQKDMLKPVKGTDYWTPEDQEAIMADFVQFLENEKW